MVSSPANGSAEWPPDDRLRRAIQYSETLMFNRDAAAYWIPAFAGMTTVGVGKRLPTPHPISCSHSSSVSTATPSSRAFVNFEPASSPAIT